MAKSDTAGLKEGKAVKFKNADTYVPQPKGRPPIKERTHCYTPDATPPKK